MTLQILSFSLLQFYNMDIVILSVYVDDIVITYSDSALLT